MLNLLTLILILLILFYLLNFKRHSIITKFKNNKINFLKERKNLNQSKTRNSKNSKIINKSQYEIHNLNNKSENKLTLRRDMFKLFKGDKEDKHKALEIAAELSDKSTLKLLKIGLKDMDSDIVKLSAELIKKFK